jgi:3-phenylpropionate/trans-cinnamate dioxygenase ferredoxin reductase component
MAAALKGDERQVFMVFPEKGIGGLMFPSDLALRLNEYYREHGVEVYPDTLVSSMEREGDGYVLHSKDGREFTADAVIAGVGIEPNDELARRAGIEVEDGVLVDRFLRTSAPDIFAAGDVARFNDPVLGEMRRVEHEDNAISMGGTAGRNMCGDPEPYDYSPYFYSDLFELGYEAVGDLDPSLDTWADWKDLQDSGAVYYLKERKLRGILLWNAFGHTDAARDLIAEGREWATADLEGRIGAGA